jgi:simple sugar transport system permease protein
MALAVGGLLIWLFGYDVGPAFSSLVRGAFGDLYAISQTLTRTTPILFAGLAVMVAFRVGLFNIGGEGQLYWGALATALVAAHLAGLPIVVVVAAAMGAGALAGALWGAIPGALKAYTGAHEVITTIMLNTIAILGTAHLTQTYFKAEGPVDQTERIPMPARMPELIPGTDITFGILIGIVIVALLHRLFTSTAVGYDFQAVGYSPGAAQYGGIRGRRVIVGAMALGGAMAGLAGGSVVMTQLFRFVSGFSPGYGFTGIAVAVLGRNNAWGVLLASLLFGALQAGGMSMQLFADIPSDLMTVVQGLVILFVAAPGLARLLQRLVRRREALGGSHVE